MFKFYVKVFYVIGKALTGELPCSCDRSCFAAFLISSEKLMSPEDNQLFTFVAVNIKCY